MAVKQKKLKAFNEFMKGQLIKGNIETDSPWNSLDFVIKKPGKDNWCLLHDLRKKKNKVIEDMGLLQPGMSFPTMLLQNWNLAVIDINDCFFRKLFPLHPTDALRFAFCVLAINREAPCKCYHRQVLPQGMENNPMICQWDVAKLLSPVHAKAGEAIILHYMDDVLVCAPDDSVLAPLLEETIAALTGAGFEIQQEKVQRLLPWRYLSLEISNRTITPQRLEISDSPKILKDLHQLCGSLNWVTPWLGNHHRGSSSSLQFTKGGR